MKKMMIHLGLAFMSAAIISSVVSIKFMSEINSNNIDFPGCTAAILQWP